MKTLQVRVKPNARQSRFEAQPDGRWLAQLLSPPTDGKANQELVAVIAHHFGLRKAQVRIKSGASGRMKRVQLDEG